MASGRKRAGRGGATRADGAAARVGGVAGPAAHGADGRDPGARIALGALALLLFLAPLVVDASAEASFDAPKRFLALLGAAVAAAACLVAPAPAAVSAGAVRTWRAASASLRASALLAIAALAGAVLAALLSPRAALSTGALRAVLPMALLVPLGASRVLERGGGAVLLAAFVAGASVDALTALLERAGVLEPFAVESVAGRGGTGALVGNEGSLALLLALGAVAALAVVLQARAPARRAAAAAALGVQVLGLAANPSLTALLAVLAGATVVAVASLGRRAVLVVATSLALLGVAAVAVPQLRARVATAAAAARAGDVDALLTYRLGPWAAAVEMVRARPLLGFGPGTFAAEFVAHRLAAEQRHRRRFVLTRQTSPFGAAHDDYLQLAAEGGLPVAAAALGAFALLLTALARRLAHAGSDGQGGRGEVVVVLGLLATGAVGALTWFPMQLAVTAPALLLALGRGWRLAAADPGAVGAGTSAQRDASAAPGHDGPDVLAQPAVRGARVLAALVLVTLVAVPELRRYAAERALARATGAVRGYVAARGTAPAGVLDDARAAALASAAALPGDPRPVLAAGAVELVAPRPQDALARYREALALGERAETNLNAGRAFAMLDQRPEAFAAFVRTGWLSPYLVSSMPAAAQPLVQEEVARLEERLRAGTLAAPPPLPDALRPPDAP